MKYFTPELYVRGQSRDDRVLDEVERLWDEAGRRYAAYLDKVRPDFPLGLRHIDERYYLHDARIRGMGREDKIFVIMLQLDTPPRSLLTFTFVLNGEPVIDREALPREHRSPDDAAEWLYDEWERVPGDPLGWEMTILLSNGWEVSLPFRDVHVQEVQAILPNPGTGSGDGLSAALPQIAR